MTAGSQLHIDQDIPRLDLDAILRDHHEALADQGGDANLCMVSTSLTVRWS